MMKSKQTLLVSFLLVGAMAIVANGQSNDRDNPTPLSSNTIKGTGVGKKVEYYYSFTAGPGVVGITIDLKAKSGSTGAEVEIFDAASNKIFYYYPNATSANEHAAKRFALKSKQTVVLRLAFDLDAGDYTIKLGGPVELPSVDSSAGGSPSPETSLPDLMVKEIAFDQQSPSQIHVRVINRGNAPSSKCFLALQSLAGDDPSLGTKKRAWTIEIPALEAGKGISKAIDVAPLTQTNGPWKATVDRSNTVAESDESNNTLMYPARSLTSPMGNPGPVATDGLPDLVIARFKLVDPISGEVAVMVRNTGHGPAGASTLRLIVWEAGQFEQKEAKTVFVKVRPLAPGQATAVHVKAGVPIVNTKYSMFIDISEEVVESNEENNRAEGEAGGL